MRCGILSIKKHRIWICRVVDYNNNKPIGWFIGNINAKTFRQLYEKLKGNLKLFYTDGWEVYQEVIPSAKLIQNKKYIIGIEQNRSNIRHYLAKMTIADRSVFKDLLR